MILEAMYNGMFYPCEVIMPKSQEYIQALKMCDDLMEKLSQRLKAEDYELVKELMAQYAVAKYEENESNFKYGFSSGLIVQHEAYEQIHGDVGK